jgi:hypothetical protein
MITSMRRAAWPSSSKKTGYELPLAHDSPKGLELVCTLPPVVAIWISAARRWMGLNSSAVRRETALPLIAVTGYGPEEGTSSLFDRFLVKPVDRVDLGRIPRELIPAPTHF